MKPKINLKSPLVIEAMNRLYEQVEIALDAPRHVEDAVIPIHCIPKSKLHNKPKTKPEQIGSGVLVTIKNNYFIFSATHVFLEFQGKAIFTGLGKGTLIENLSGDRYSTGKLNSTREDSYDASVFHIQSDLSEALKSVAITLDDFDFDDTQGKYPVFMAAGFRAKKSNTAGNQINTEREVFSTTEYRAAYSLVGIDPQSHIALGYDNQILVNGSWNTSPIPRGISGGAIIRVDGTDARYDQFRKSTQKQLLTAITIEQHREKYGKPGLLIGTRVNVFMGLIAQAFPGLLDDYMTTLKND
ncbi:hypothetical protein GCM10028808_57470 [Spirosoma migulaei]